MYNPNLVKKLINFLIYIDYCPIECDLKGACPKSPKTDCVECWDKALSDEGEEKIEI